MPSQLSDNMNAINRYFMEQVTIRTPAAERVKQEWMAWWKENKRDWTWYTQDEYDHARNLRNKLNLANAKSDAERVSVAAHIATAKGSTEEQMGEVRRSGTSGMFYEEPEPLIPTAWKVAAVVGTGLITLGVFAKQIIRLTPYGRFAKYLP